MPKEFSFVWLIPLFPLLAAIVTPLLGRVLGKAAHFPALIGAALAFLFAIITLLAGIFEVHKWTEPHHVVLLREWISIGSFHTSLALQVDPLSITMLTTVTGVGLMVFVFSVGYMHGDQHYARFFTFLSLFLFSMCMLVLADNFVLLYVFWEAVGLCSYLLIGFWFTKPSAADAAKKAFLVNRIGDFGFGIGILLIWTFFGSLQYTDVFQVAADPARWAGAGTLSNGEYAALSATGFVPGREITFGILAAICLCLFWGATGKSAQLPLYVWLPDAMEGPTPVSALIHAATMVTAGVYMVARCSPLFFPGTDGAWPSHWMLTPPDVVAIVGGLTALFAATIALGQYDMKRILAYSTISQLGYMFLALGIGGTGAAIFHMHTHAFFKAALFLSAGVVMHATHGELDIRKIGGLRRQLPVTFWVFLVASLALAGFPLTAGFFSKDAILHEAFQVKWPLGVLGLLTALITAFYTFRLFFRAFWGREHLPEELHGHVHAPDAWMTAPIVVLAVMSVLAGFYGMGAHLGAFGSFLDKTPYMHIVNGEFAHEGAHGMPEWVGMLLSTAVVLLGIRAAWAMFVRRGRDVFPEEPAELRELLENKYWVDEVYYYLLVWPLEQLAAFLRVFDKAVVDGAVTVVGFAPRLAGYVIRPFQSGYLQSYGLYMVLGLAVIGLLVLNRLR